MALVSNALGRSISALEHCDFHSPEITRITHDRVAGRSIDMAALRAPIEPADLLIAHNASFDRPFCEVFSDLFAGKAWACSNSQIDWVSPGYGAPSSVT